MAGPEISQRLRLWRRDGVEAPKSFPDVISANFSVAAANSPFQRQHRLAASCMEAIASWSQAETYLLRAEVTSSAAHARRVRNITCGPAAGRIRSGS